MKTFVLQPTNARAGMAAAWDAVRAIIETPNMQARVRVDEHKRTRSLEQNDKMWAVLGDISKQVLWPVDGKAQLLDPEDWKHILSAGLLKHDRVAMGVDGGFVILGQRTSKMTIRQMTDLIELAHAFGAEHGVEWSEP